MIANAKKSKYPPGVVILPSVHRRLKILVAHEGGRLQEHVAEALMAYITKWEERQIARRPEKRTASAT